MPTLSFGAQVGDFAKQTKIAAEAVFHKSAERVTEVMQTPRGEGGNMPIDTAYLQNSLQGSNDQMPQIREDARPVPGQVYSYDSGPINLIINNTPLGGTVYLGFTASYAGFQEFGTSKMEGRFFVTLAAQRWNQIVKETEGELTTAMK